MKRWSEVDQPLPGLDFDEAVEKLRQVIENMSRKPDEREWLGRGESR